MILFFESPKSQDRSREISHGAPLGVGEAVASRARSRNRIPVRRSVEDRTTPFEQPTSEEPCGNKGGRLYGKTGFNRNTGNDFRLNKLDPFLQDRTLSGFKIRFYNSKFGVLSRPPKIGNSKLYAITL